MVEGEVNQDIKYIITDMFPGIMFNFVFTFIIKVHFQKVILKKEKKKVSVIIERLDANQSSH